MKLPPFSFGLITSSYDYHHHLVNVDVDIDDVAV
jgi:hypothetical protein